MAYQLRFSFILPPEHIVGLKELIWINIVIKITLLYAFNMYYIAWRYFVLRDARQLMIALMLSAMVFVFYVKFIYVGAFPRTIILIDFLVSFFLLGVFRFLKRASKDLIKNEDVNPTLIIGANQKSINIISSCFNNELDYFPVAVVDDDQRVINSYLSNIKVNPFEKMHDLIYEHSIMSAIITKNYSPDDLNELFDQLNAKGIHDVKLYKALGNKDEKLMDISIEDLLARTPKDLDDEAIASFIKDKVVLVTGAGGSIGSEIVRQCAKYKVKRLLLLDHSEYNLYKIDEEIKNTPTKTMMLSVADKKLLTKCFQIYQPQIVIHAAAYKHVPLCEENIEGAILNNIIGTKNCIDLSIEYGVQKFVMVSTDKAVRPTNVMGTTKRVCELYAQNVHSKNTLLTAVRFGNVLGSSGSVIPKFKEQIQNNQPLSVTHKDITRYFMLIPEACRLVLQAASIAKDRELFILDMGKPIKIVDLAKKMLKLYGKSDLGIEYTGLRKGEKLYEELLIDENNKKTSYKSIMIASATKCNISLLNQQIEQLLECNKDEERLSILKKIVPEFDHKI
jgi:UDP-N-acetyl-D-glucosamine 4,6-dehydratase